MASRKSLNLLPSIFQTNVNRKFLSATVDQLISEPNLVNIYGYIGRKFAPTFKKGDAYINESTADRQNYQLEPSIVITDEDQQVSFFASYVDLLNKIKYYGGTANNHNRLFENEYYSYDPGISYDKLINFSHYYWLPNGPDAVEVNTGFGPLEETFTVDRRETAGIYEYKTANGQLKRNLQLIRGGVYKFVVNQPGNKFWIQSELGVDGTLNAAPTISSRTVYGVTNNGVDVGTITFEVPQKAEQERFAQMTTVFQVDYAAPLAYADLHNSRLSVFQQKYPQYGGVTSQLDGKHLIFVDEFVNTSRGEEAWTARGIYDYRGFQSLTYDEGDIVPLNQRYGVWKIVFLDSGYPNDPIIRLVYVQPVNIDEKVYVKYGLVNANLEFYKDTTGFFKRVPLLTALQEELFIQDQNAPGIYTRIKIVDAVNSFIDVPNDILGMKTYTSPNGIEFTSGLKIEFGSDVIPETYKNKQFYVENVGDAINLVDVELLVRAEQYVEDLTTLYPDQIFPEYITIKRDAVDLNPWTRNNRWFHSDIIAKTAVYNNTQAIYDQKLRAQRPIVQFEGNYHLINQGRIGVAPVDALDTESLYPFNDFEGKEITFAFGVPLFDGFRVLFASAIDPEVRNKIYKINYVQFDADPVTGQLIGPFYIQLSLADDTPLEPYTSTVVKSGFYKGSGWWFDGQGWVPSQEKTSAQQEPLFDVFDKEGKSLSTYPNSTFRGTKVFGYIRNTAGPTDTVLGFPLKYRNFGTQGDIEFKNFYDTDTFDYEDNGRIISGLKISENGFLNKIVSRYETVPANSWRVIAESSKQYQIFSFVYDDPKKYQFRGQGQIFKIDVVPQPNENIPHLKIFKNNQFISESDYQIVDKDITILAPLEQNDKIDILVFSNQISKIAYYEIPANLNLNAQNIDLDQFTLGQIRNHLVALSQNSLELDRPVIGPNNLRDLELKDKGGTILQHSAPSPYASIFLLDDTANLINALRFNQNEYTKFKNKFLELSTTLPGVNPTNPRVTVDLIISNINAIKNISFPWFYSDMVPHGNLFDEIEYVIFDPTIRSYEITNIFDDTKLSNKAVLVYRNDILLVKDVDYTFDLDRPAITFTSRVPLAIDDIIKFVEYTNTDGNFIPDTPSKLGLYPKFIPEIYLDDTYRNPILVIKGHDGSITPAFKDYRDALLLELEKRIYNNIKLPRNIDYTDVYTVLPGKFRNNDYTRKEITQLLSKNFMSWLGTNRLEFNDNISFKSNDPFTWNYSRFVDRIDSEYLPGSWRACYLYFYDTIRPNTAPWEMLGFSDQPDWWEEFYGPAPFTGGNQVLWEDLELGLIRQGPRAGIDKKFARPGLSKFIPVDVNGNLIAPSGLLAKATQARDAATSWSVGEYGPTEWAWRSSSDFPFAVQQALALAKPARYFSLKYDVSTYLYNSQLEQYLNVSNNRHFRQSDLKVHGATAAGVIERTSGYSNIIASYLKNLGIDAKVKIDSMIKTFNVNLAYKVAGYTDKKFLRVLAEQSSPSSTNDSVLIPDENYKISLFKSAPVQRAIYSGVIIEKTSNGYSVSGFNTNDPYFTIIPSISNSNGYLIRILDSTATVFTDFKNQKITVPYGYEFKNQQQVADFLISYERYLLGQGFVFNQYDNVLNELRNWKLSVKEFLFWAQQGWRSGSILYLSPVANELYFNTNNAVVDKIEDSQYGSKVIDQNYNIVRNAEYDVLREDNNFAISLADSTRSIAYVELNLVQYEHVMIFDNSTVFNDIVYKPELGNRQFRLKLLGQKTGEWNGSIYAPGFIWNNDKVPQWVQGKDYYRGELIDYKNQYYVAMSDIPGTVDFPYDKWKQISQTEIKTGLLNNFSTIAKHGELSYDSYTEFKDENQLRYAHSLIGFKPRQYLEDLGVNDTTQIEFYKGYIRQKGTINAILQLTKAEFNNLSSDIDLYEEWAIRVGEYGALGINPFVEFRLDENLFSINPSVMQFRANTSITQLGTSIIFGPQELYRTFGQYNGQIALARDDSSYYDQDIPTAGYVHLDDVDTTIFDLNDVENIKNELENIGIGYRIWVAKDFNNDWNVFRVSETNNFVIRVENSLDNFITITTDFPHKFQKNDVCIIRYFNQNVDGIYQVSRVIDLYSYTVLFTGDFEYYQTLISEDGNGVIFKLDSMRYYYMEDARIYGLNNPLNYWRPGDKIWIDYDAATSVEQGQSVDTPSKTWKVYEKTEPWNKVQRLDKNLRDYGINDGYGSAVKISDDGLYAVAGSPGANVFVNGIMSQLGHVVTLNKIKDRATGIEEFLQGDTVYPLVNALSNVTPAAFGYSVDLAKEYLIVGAPESQVDTTANVGLTMIYKRPAGILQYEPYQILLGNTAEQSNYGASVTCSEYGDWVFVGAPAADKVYVYGLNQNIKTVDQLVSVSDQQTITLSGIITANAGDILSQYVSYNVAYLSLSGNVNAFEGQIITQTTGANVANAVVLSTAADSFRLTVRVISGNLVANTSANLTIDGAWFSTNVSVANLFQSQVGSTIQAEITAPVTAGNLVYVRDPIGLYLGTGNLGFTVDSLVHSGPFMPTPVNTGLTVLANANIKITDSISLNFIPDLAITSPGNVSHSLLVTDFTRIFVPEKDYIVVGNVVNFVSGNLATGDYLIRQRPFYQLLEVLQGPTGSEFGYSLDASLDGAQLGVGTPNDTVNVGVQTDGIKLSIPVGTSTANITSYREFPGAGSVYVYDRVIEAFNTTGELDYRTTYPVQTVTKVSIDDDEVADYRLLDANTIRFDNPPPIGKVIYVETNKFNLLEKLIGIDSLEGGLAAIQESARFGTDLTICSNNCAIYVGAPNYSSGINYNIGAVWKFHNKGRLYGTNRGFRLNPTFKPNDSIRIDNYEVKVKLRLSGNVVANVGDVITQTVSGANVIVVKSTSSVGQPYLEVSDYDNTNIFTLGSGNISINGSPAGIYPVNSNLDNFVEDINDANLLGVSAFNENGYLRISTDKTVAKNLLRVLSGRNVSGNADGVSNVYDAAGMAIFAFMQIIVTPYNNSGEHFGNRVVLAKNAYMLVIGSDRGTTFLPTTFDNYTTNFDDESTEFIDGVVGSGSVYVYELYDDPRDMVEHPGRYAFAQQLNTKELDTGDKFGADIDIGGGYIIAGAPADDHVYIVTVDQANISLRFGDTVTQPAVPSAEYKVLTAYETVDNANTTTIKLAPVSPQMLAVDEFILINGIDVGAKVISFGGDTGSLYIFSNPLMQRGWNLIRYEQPKVDIESVNRIFLYDSVRGTIKTNIEFIDPAKGKIFGIAEQEITYKTAFDPAFYNRGDNSKFNITNELYWNSSHVGQVWWNLDKVRFIDYEQGGLNYRGANWGRLFPGSVIEIAEWVESSVPPIQYVDSGADGVPLYQDNSGYVETIYVDPITNIITNKYYYWVTGKNSVDLNNLTRRLPTNSIADLIENPRSQNIPYAAILRRDSLAFYNISNFLSADETICHVDYEIKKNNSIIHSEYEFIQEGNPFSLVPEKLASKVIDSLSGQDRLGRAVPDPHLNPYDRIGTQFRPRQSLVVDRLAALENFISYANSILVKYPVVREFSLNNFNSEEPLPPENEYDLVLETQNELGLIDTARISTGYRVLVKADTLQDNLWAIYQFTPAKTWQVFKTQSYKTSLYWEFIDWYEEGFDSTEVIEYVVDTLVDALKLPAQVGDEILVRINVGVIPTGWNLLTVQPDGAFRVVGIQNGTVRIKENLYDFANNKLGFGNQPYDFSRYDQSPGIETRNILLGLKEDVFVRQLSEEFNKIFFVLVNYIFTEQKSVDWIFKTSFVSVTHRLRALTTYPNYVKDNQSYYLDYINEVKPYSTKVREYNVAYAGDDEFSGDVTDFDLPPYYDIETKTFRSPSGELGDKDRQLWATGYIGDRLINIDYPSWYNNKDHTVTRFIVEDPGFGYNSIPEILVIGGGDTVTRQATGVAVIDNDTGQLLRIDLVDSGEGYSITPRVLINGSSEIPARAYAVLENRRIRTFDTAIKFDRVAYGSKIKPWEPNTFYEETTYTTINGKKYWTGGDIITHLSVDGDLQVRTSYEISANVVTGETFNATILGNVVLAGEFTSAGDRILAYYQPADDMQPRDLKRLINGLEYPGVEVTGLPFTDQTGFAGIHTANITFSQPLLQDSGAPIAVGNVITQPEADILLMLDHSISSATIGQYVSQTTGANALVYGNTITHGVNNGNLLGTLGDVVNDNRLYLIKLTTDEFDANANVWINGVEQSIAYWGNVVTEEGVDLVVFENRISSGELREEDIISKYFENNTVTYTTNIAPYQWANVGIRPLESNVGGQWLVELPVPDATITVTKVLAPNKIQGRINTTQDFITGTTSLLAGNVRVNNGDLQDSHPIDIDYISSTDVGVFDSLGFDNVDVDEFGNPVLSEKSYDTLIRSFYTDSALGVRPEDINIDGGEYVDTYSSYAPEELVPGVVFDTLDIKVFHNAVGTTIHGFRVFTRNFQYGPYSVSANTITNFSEITHLRLCDDAASKLTQSLRLGDTRIYVEDASVFSEPSPQLAEPGVVFIGSERITYYERNLTENYLGRIRRGTKGTAAKDMHQFGAMVIDSSRQQLLPDTIYANVSMSSVSNVSANVNTTIASLLYDTHANGKPVGTGMLASSSDTAEFIKSCNARNILGTVVTRAIEIEPRDVINTEEVVTIITTEDGDDLYEEDF